MKTQSGPLCGVVDVDLVRKVVSDAKLDVGVNVRRSDDVAGQNVIDCSVRNMETSTSFLKISVVPESDPKAAAQELAAHTKPEYGSGAFRKYDGEPGVGYGADYTTGPWADGTQVSVVRGQRTYEVFVFNWPDATPAERQKLAEDMVVNAATNLDRAQPKTTNGTRQVVVASDGSVSDSSQPAPDVPIDEGVRARLSDRLG